MATLTLCAPLPETFTVLIVRPPRLKAIATTDSSETRKRTRALCLQRRAETAVSAGLAVSSATAVSAGTGAAASLTNGCALRGGGGGGGGGGDDAEVTRTVPFIVSGWTWQTKS
jgi:hypothetical protein